MKFHLNHDLANKTLTIPRAALQLSGLTETSDLTIHTENGCVLLLPEKAVRRANAENFPAADGDQRGASVPTGQKQRSGPRRRK